MKTKTEPTKNAEGFRRAVELLPYYLRHAIQCTIAENSLFECEITDIRLRRDGICAVSAGKRSYPLIGISLSARKLDELIFSLCEGSLYAHADTIREGYITSGGIRIGVCGRAVTDGDRLLSVSECSSLTIRIPHDVPGCADELYTVWRRHHRRGILIYSQPGVGKTTILRDFIRLLTLDGHQFAVIDARGELQSAAKSASADILTQYPKAEGIRSAVRSLSPEFIICDELSGKNDAEAALYALSSGVPLIATTHANDRTELALRPDLKPLLESSAFTLTVGLRRMDGNSEFALDISEAK